MNKDSMRLWNSGLTAKEILEMRNIDVSADFKEIEERIGCRSLTIAEIEYCMIGAEFPPREETEEYKRWKGTSGAGKQLREMIAAI